MNELINYPAIKNYIRQHVHSPIELASLRKFSTEHNIPIISEEVEALLIVLLQMKQPSKILEFGTAIGYSSLLFANIAKNSQITTLERDKEMMGLAKENFEQHHVLERIEMIGGSALETAECLSGDYDFIFLDGGKSHYLEFLQKIEDKIVKNALIVSDNILFKGLTASTEEIPRKHRTIVNGMRKYVDYICHSDRYTTSLLPLSDGVAISIKK